MNTNPTTTACYYNNNTPGWDIVVAYSNKGEVSVKTYIEDKRNE